MYIATIPNRNSPPSILLREGYREDGKVKNRTLANLTKLPPEAITVLKRALAGEPLVSVDEWFKIVEDGSPAHGNVEAVMIAMKRLGFAHLLCSRPSRQRDIVVAMVAARILDPQSKFATSRSWSNTTLSDLLGIGDPDEDELYEAMDWLLDHQDDIEKKLASRRSAKRRALLDATVTELEKVRHLVARGKLFGREIIDDRVSKVLEQHFVLEIKDNSFSFTIDQEKVNTEAALDGIYVIRTSVAKDKMGADDAVRSYKQLAHVERAFRCLKSVDLMVRPIRHHLENRVRAHIFLCTLAYYVQWHMMEAWRPPLFADEDQEAKESRDPVAPAKRSVSAMRKIHTKRLDDKSVVHSFRTLLNHLGMIVRNTCILPKAGSEAATFYKTTTPNPKQQQALNLLSTIKV